MLRYEASSSPCKAALYVEEDPSLSLRMTSKKSFCHAEVRSIFFAL
ncbi:hypothetical protein [Mucilaginibacter rubeus]|nr:hypothetical protein [Mucilaginibacter rubeus]